jgi:hypothetical protein
VDGAHAVSRQCLELLARISGHLGEHKASPQAEDQMSPEALQTISEMPGEEIKALLLGSRR